MTSDRADPLLLDNQLCFALYSATLAMTRVYRPLLDHLGLTYPQYLVMLVLWEDDGATMKTLGTRLHLDSGTLTPLLKRMETQGVLTRQRDAADERLVRVHLTPVGAALRERARAVPVHIFQATGCTAPTLAALRQSLLDLRGELEQSV